MPIFGYFARSRSRGRSPLLDMTAAQNVGKVERVLTLGSLFAGLAVQQYTVSFFSPEKSIDIDVRVEVSSFAAKTGYCAYVVYLKITFWLFFKIATSVHT